MPLRDRAPLSTEQQTLRDLRLAIISMPPLDSHFILEQARALRESTRVDIRIAAAIALVGAELAAQET